MSIRAIRGQKKIPNNSWAIIFRGISVAPAKDNFKLSQVVPVVVTKTDTFIDLGVKCLEGTTERSDGNRGRSPRIVVTESMCLEGTTPQDLPQSSIPLIALVPIRATDPVAIYSIVFIRVHSCNSWAKKNSQ